MPFDQQDHQLQFAVPMVGRNADLQRLIELFYAATEHHVPQLVTIIGEPGVGKSRLISELLQRLIQLPEPLLLWQGKATSQTEKLPYAPIRDLFASAFGIYENDCPITARSKFEQGIIAALGAENIEKAHVMGHLIGFGYAESILSIIAGALGDRPAQVW